MLDEKKAPSSRQPRESKTNGRTRNVAAGKTANHNANGCNAIDRARRFTLLLERGALSPAPGPLTRPLFGGLTGSSLLIGQQAASLRLAQLKAQLALTQINNALAIGFQAANIPAPYTTTAPPSPTAAAINLLNLLKIANTMSRPLFNPYASGDQSSTQGPYGLSRVQAGRDPLGASPQFGPWSSFCSSAASSANSGVTTPSPQAQSANDNDIERSVEMHISRAREVTYQGKQDHQPTGQSALFPSTQRDVFLSSGTGTTSYPMASTSASLGPRRSDVGGGSSSLDWLTKYRRAATDDSSKLYSSPASSSYTSSKFNSSSDRVSEVQSIPGLGDFDYPVQDQPPMETHRPKYTPESASNILSKFGLEREDLEYLISFPDEQMTPANLPFILHQIRNQKAKKATTAVQSNPDPEPRPARGESGRDSLSSSGGPSAVLQPTKVVDYGHTGNYAGGVVEEFGRTSGALSLVDTCDRTEVKSRALGSSPGQGSSVTNSSYNSTLSSVAPPSNHLAKPLKTKPIQAPQKSPCPSALPRKDKGGDCSNFIPLIKTVSDRCQSASSTQPSCTLFRGLHPDRPGLVLIGTNSTKGSLVRKQRHKQLNQKRQMQALQQQGMNWTQELQVPVMQAAAQPAPPVLSATDASRTAQPPVFIPRPAVAPPAPLQPVTGPENFPWSLTHHPAARPLSEGRPTLSMMQDYAAATPQVFPHDCSLCHKECAHMQDWVSHQNSSLHLESCRVLRAQYPGWNGGIEVGPSAASEAKPSCSTSAPTSQNRRKKTSHGSRSPSPRGSRHTRSPPLAQRYGRYSSPTRSHDRQRRWFSPSRRFDRRSSPRRSHEARSPRDRRSSSSETSPQRTSSSAGKLVQKLLEESAAQSVSRQSEAAVKIEASASTKPKVDKSSPPTMVRLGGILSSLSRDDVVAAVEQFGKLKSVLMFRSKQEALVCFEKEEDAEKLKSIKSIKGIPVTVGASLREKDTPHRKTPQREPVASHVSGHQTPKSTRTTTHRAPPTLHQTSPDRPTKSLSSSDRPTKSLSSLDRPTKSLSSSDSPTKSLSSSASPTKSVSSTDRPTKSLSSSASPTKSVSSTDRPTKSLSSSASPTKSVSSTDRPTKSLSSSDRPTKSLSSSASPTKSVSSPDRPTKSVSSSDRPTKSVSSSDRPTKSVSSSDRPTKSVSSSDRPTKSVSSSDRPTKSLSSSDRHTKSLSSSDRPTKSLSSSDRPTKSLSSSDRPTKSLSSSDRHTKSLSSSDRPTKSLSSPHRPTKSLSSSDRPTKPLSSSDSPDPSCSSSTLSVNDSKMSAPSSSSCKSTKHSSSSNSTLVSPNNPKDSSESTEPSTSASLPSPETPSPAGLRAQGKTRSHVKASPSAARGRDKTASAAVVEESTETPPEGAVATSDHRVSAKSLAEKNAESSETRPPAWLNQDQGNKPKDLEKGEEKRKDDDDPEKRSEQEDVAGEINQMHDSTHEQMDDGDRGGNRGVQLPEENLQVFNGEREPDASFQGVDSAAENRAATGQGEGSSLVEDDDGSTVQQLSEEDVTLQPALEDTINMNQEAINEEVSGAGRRRSSRGKGDAKKRKQIEEKDKRKSDSRGVDKPCEQIPTDEEQALNDEKDVTEQETFEVLDPMDDEPPSDQMSKDIRGTEVEGDATRAVDSVAADDAKEKTSKRGKTTPRRDDGPSTRSRPRTRASKRGEKETSPLNQDRAVKTSGARTKTDTTAEPSENDQEIEEEAYVILDSVEDEPVRDATVRRRSQRGKKEEKPHGDDEEDGAVTEKLTATTRSTRGRTMKKDSPKEEATPTRRLTPARESQREAKKKSDVVTAREVRDEVPTYEILDSVEDEEVVKEERPATGGRGRRGRPKKAVKATKKECRREKVEEVEVDTKKLETLDEVGGEMSAQVRDLQALVTLDEIVEDNKEAKVEQCTLELRPPSKEDKSVDSLNPETPLTTCDDEEEKKTYRSAERKHDDVTVVSKRRRELVRPEAKRSRSQSPPSSAGFKLPPFIPDNPLGQEFVVPRSGYFCNICRVFYLNESSAREQHCVSQRHYDNLQAHYQKLRSSTGSRLNS